MKVITSDDKVPKSFSTFIEPAIFLAGPTPRDPETPSWRPEALDLLSSSN